MKSHDKAFDKLLLALKEELADISWQESERFSWDPRHKTIFFSLDTEHPKWSLLHEAGHAKCDHERYSSDIELLKMEVEAWQAAKVLATELGEAIDQDHVEDCLDSYRDWLHRRSKCPHCEQNGIESPKGTYCCINCTHSWTVSEQRFCRVYRKSKKVAR